MIINCKLGAKAAGLRLRILFIVSITVLLICFSVGNTTAQKSGGLNFILRLTSQPGHYIRAKKQEIPFALSVGQ